MPDGVLSCSSLFLTGAKNADAHGLRKTKQSLGKLIMDNKCLSNKQKYDFSKIFPSGRRL